MGDIGSVASLRVIIADDDASVRARLRRALQEAPGLDLVAIARDGAEAWRIASELIPDVLVLDEDMPVAGGLEVLARLRAELPDIKVVMYVTNTPTCAHAAGLGAADCVAKTEPLERLVSAIRVAGRAVTDPQRSA